MMTLFSFILSFLSFILVFNFTLFFLDDFKLSQNKYIRILQLLSPLLLLLFVFLTYYKVGYVSSVIFIDEPGKNNISIGARVEVGKDAATEISKGISSVGSNVGLAGTVGAITASVAKVITKSSMPPVQKAGVVIASSVVGAGIHIGASALNRSNSSIVSSTTKQLPNSGSTSTGIDKSDIVHKLIDDHNNSVLSDLLLSIDMITSACLGLIIILSIMILFKFYLNEDKVKLNLVSLIGDGLNNSFNYYLIKIIQLNKKTSTVYIYIILFVLLVGLGFDCYFINELYNNLDKFVDIHINSRK